MKATLRVQRKACSSCIFRKDCTLDLNKLLDDVRERGPAGRMDFFRGHRICHHSKDAVCRGFWNRFKNKFALGQIAQRLGLVEYVDDDVLKTKGRKHA